MSLNLIINSCQKVCVSIPPSCPLTQPYTWVSSAPSIVIVDGNNLNAIIRTAYGSIGTYYISIIDSFSTTVFVIVVNVIDYLNTIVANPAYQYIFSGKAAQNTPTGLKATITGAFNSLVNPLTPGLCIIGMPEKATGVNFINGGIFVPGTNSRMEFYGTWSVSSILTINFAIFQPTGLGNDTDPLIPYASSFTTEPTNPNQPVQSFTVGLFPCDIPNYISFVQLNESANNRKIISSKYNGGYLDFQFNLLNPTTTYSASAIIVPAGYTNLSSTSILYTRIVQITVPNSLANQTVNVTIPSISPDAVWFAQQQSVDNSKATSINVLRVSNNGPTTVSFDYDRLLAGASFTTNVGLIAYKPQPTPPFTLNVTF